MAVCAFCGSRNCRNECRERVESVICQVATTTPFTKDEIVPFAEMASEYVDDELRLVEMLRRLMFLVDCERVKYEELKRAKRDANAVRKQNG